LGLLWGEWLAAARRGRNGTVPRWLIRVVPVNFFEVNHFPVAWSTARYRSHGMPYGHHAESILQPAEEQPIADR